MQEQSSSTTKSNQEATTQPAKLSCQYVCQGLSDTGRPKLAVRIGALVLGCAVLGAVSCRHALAGQDSLSGQAAVSASVNTVFPLALDSNQLSASQTRAIGEFNWIALSGAASEQATLTAHKSSPEPTHIVTIATERRTTTLPYRRIYRMSRAAQLGQTDVARQGQAGVLERTYKVTYRDNVPVAYRYQGRRVVKSPVDMIIDAGYTDRAAMAMPSRSGLYTRAREIDMVATGYSPMEGSATGRCANGMRAGYGVVAVDPRLIPLGSKLFVEGYGYAFAGDTGGAIKGRRIDLGQNTYHAASMVGRRKVHVYVLSDAYSR